MKLFRRYKWLIIGFFVLVIVLMAWVFKDVFFEKEGALYGHRLEGVEKVPVDSAEKKDISDLLLSKTGVKKATVNVQGKIIYIVFYVDSTVTIDNAKAIAAEALKKCTSDQLSFYDVSFLIDYAEKTDKKDFPVAGSKSNSSDVIVW